MAELWISTHAAAYIEREGATLAITQKKTGVLMGAIGFNVNLKNGWAEIGYWVGKPYWGHGYATEALRALIPWAFDAFPLNRLQACHFTRNPASGRVMQKAGMTDDDIQMFMKHNSEMEHMISTSDIKRAALDAGFTEASVSALHRDSAFGLITLRKAADSKSKNRHPRSRATRGGSASQARP